MDGAPDEIEIFKSQFQQLVGNSIFIRRHNICKIYENDVS